MDNLSEYWSRVSTRHQSCNDSAAIHMNRFTWNVFFSFLTSERDVSVVGKHESSSVTHASSGTRMELIRCWSTLEETRWHHKHTIVYIKNDSVTRTIKVLLSCLIMAGRKESEIRGDKIRLHQRFCYFIYFCFNWLIKFFVMNVFISFEFKTIFIFILLYVYSGWMDGFIDGWRDKWRDGWVDVWMYS